MGKLKGKSIIVTGEAGGIGEASAALFKEKAVALVDTTPEDFDHVIAVNVRGVFLGSRNLGAYVTSKHAALGLARTAALELAASGIRVNTIHPGPIENRMMRSIEEQIAPGHGTDVKHGFEQLVSLGRYGKNEEIARLALFLASDDASYCTGSAFVADGGFTAQ